MQLINQGIKRERVLIARRGGCIHRLDFEDFFFICVLYVVGWSRITVGDYCVTALTLEVKLAQRSLSSSDST